MPPIQNMHFNSMIAINQSNLHQKKSIHQSTVRVRKSRIVNTIKDSRETSSLKKNNFLPLMPPIQKTPFSSMISINQSNLHQKKSTH